MEEIKYDIAIIGSGLGGLACGSILSQRGYKVCVLEKHFQIGGCLQDFKRNDVVFDTGMHYIGSYDDGQILNTLFRYFGIYDKVEASKLNKNGFDILSICGKEYSVPQGMQQYKDMLLKMFPQEKKAIETYLHKIEQVYQSVDVINLREIEIGIMPEKEGAGDSIYDFITGLTENKELQNVLGMMNSLYGGKKVSASLYEHAIINMFYLHSAWKLDAGGGQIAKGFKKVIEDAGGSVKINSKVTKLLCEGGHANELLLESGELVKADKFISNIDPVSTMEMLEGGNIRKAYTKRLKGLEQTTSCFSVYVVLKENSLKYLNANYYHYEEDDVWGLDNYSEETWPQGYMMYSHKSKANPEYDESLIILSPMDYDEMAEWEDTTIEKRGESYLKMKEEKADKLIQLVKKKYPEIESCIKKVYTSSPLSYRDYTGVRKGAMYGVLRDCRHPFESQILPKTRIDNLFLTGQNINLHGILGVSVGAVLTCGEIEGVNNLISDIKSHKVNPS